MRAIFGFLLCTHFLSAQQLSGAGTQWSDTFVAWDIYTFETIEPATDTTRAETEEVKIGDVKQRWLDAKEDWSEWDFTIADRQGTIKLKWKNDPSYWELRTFDGNIVTMKTIWNGDFTQWRIDNGDISLDLKSRYTTDFGEWIVSDRKYGNYKISVKYSNDPRDWEITDELNEEVPVTVKMAMLFVVIYHSSPRQ